MKIVYVFPQFVDSAGTERILIDKMNYLVEQEGYDITVVTNEQKDRPFVFPISSKIRHIDVDVSFLSLYKYNKITRCYKLIEFYRQYKRKFCEVLSVIQPDAVIATTYYPYILSAIDACPLRFARVLESHTDKRYLKNSDSFYQRVTLTWLRSYFETEYVERKVRNFDVLVALNALDSDDWSRYVRTKVIMNMVHLNPMGRFCSQDSKHVIFVGRYTEQKGIFDLFRIWELVSTKHPDWHLDLYGSGNLYEDVLSESARLDVNIHVHKPEGDIFEKYLDSAFLVLTSFFEPFGLVMPEAMSCGMPVIAFDCPSGPSMIINDGVDGFLVKNRDITQFAEKVCFLIENPDIRRSMGMAAASSAQRFAPEQVMPQWTSLFQNLIKERR